MSDPKPNPREVVREGLRELLTTGPLWLRVLVAAALLSLGALTHRTCLSGPEPSDPPSAPSEK